MRKSRVGPSHGFRGNGSGLHCQQKAGWAVVSSSSCPETPLSVEGTQLCPPQAPPHSLPGTAPGAKTCQISLTDHSGCFPIPAVGIGSTTAESTVGGDFPTGQSQRPFFSNSNTCHFSYSNISSIGMLSLNDRE